MDCCNGIFAVCAELSLHIQLNKQALHCEYIEWAVIGNENQRILFTALS